MSTNDIYHDQLLQSAATLAYSLDGLLGYGFRFELFDELQSGALEFEDGEPLNFDPDLLKNSDKRIVIAIYNGICEGYRTLDSLLNLNGISSEKLKELYSEEFTEPQILGRDPKKLHEVLDEASHFITMQVFYLMNYCYCLIHNVEDVPHDIAMSIGIPDEETLAFLETNDTNVNLLKKTCVLLNGIAIEIDEIATEEWRKIREDKVN